MAAVRITREAALVATGCSNLSDYLADRHFDSADALVAAARAIWWGGDGIDALTDSPVSVGVSDWLAAFASHPRIGNKEDLKKASEREEREESGGGGGGGDSSVKPLSHAAAAATEQAGAASASQQTREELSAWNALYERRFGHIYIVCASGRSGEEMLAGLKRRYLNPPYSELAVAAEEHIKIAEKRLRGILSSSSSSSPRSGGSSGGSGSDSLSPAAAAALRTETLSSHVKGATPATASTARPPITTHVLDTALGRPAAGVRVRLLARPRGAPAGARAWVLAPGSPSSTAAAAATATDGDGRCSTLLAPGAPRPPPGHYRIEFDVGEYFERTVREVPGYGGGGVVAVANGGGGGNGAFYPSAAVEFVISPLGDSSNSSSAVPRPDHLHIPLTFSPFGYSTYRGS